MHISKGKKEGNKDGLRCFEELAPKQGLAQLEVIASEELSSKRHLRKGFTNRSSRELHF